MVNCVSLKLNINLFIRASCEICRQVVLLFARLRPPSLYRISWARTSNRFNPFVTHNISSFLLSQHWCTQQHPKQHFYHFPNSLGLPCLAPDPPSSYFPAATDSCHLHLDWWKVHPSCEITLNYGLFTISCVCLLWIWLQQHRLQTFHNYYLPSFVVYANNTWLEKNLFFLLIWAYLFYWRHASRVCWHLESRLCDSENG